MSCPVRTHRAIREAHRNRFGNRGPPRWPLYAGAVLNRPTRIGRAISNRHQQNRRGSSRVGDIDGGAPVRGEAALRERAPASWSAGEINARDGGTAALLARRPFSWPPAHVYLLHNWQGAFLSYLRPLALADPADLPSETSEVRLPSQALAAFFPVWGPDLGFSVAC